MNNHNPTTEKSSLIYLERKGDIAFLCFDKPDSEVNIIDISLAADFHRLLDEVETDPTLIGAVLISKKKGFMGGADIKQFIDLPNEEVRKAAAEGHQLIKRLSLFPKPIVSAIHGACMGGGTEISLGCTAIVVSEDPSTMMALPEVKLGLLPGMGGTIRLWKRVGTQQALDITLSGKNVYAKKAYQLGLADKLCNPAQLTETAIQMVGDLASGTFNKVDKRNGLSKFLDSNPLTRKLVFNLARKTIQRKAKGLYPALPLIIDSIEFNTSHNLDQCIENEINLFCQLLQTPEAQELIQLFFTITDLKKNPYNDKALAPKSIGLRLNEDNATKLSFSLLKKDCNVCILSADEHEVDDIQKGLGKLIENEKRKGILTQEKANSMFEKLTHTIDKEVPQNLDFLIIDEQSMASVSVPENTIVACFNPSKPLSELNQQLPDLVGFQYGSPVDKSPLLEIILTETNTNKAKGTAWIVGSLQGKNCIFTQNEAFVPKLLKSYFVAALQLLQAGNSIAYIDKQAKVKGFSLAPFEWMDELGIEAVNSLLQGDFQASLSSMADKRFMGKSTLKGFYLYKKDKKIRKLKSNPDVLQLFDQTNDSQVADIGEYLHQQMLAEVQECQDNNLLFSEKEGNLGAIFGAGYPPFLGGPFSYLSKRTIN
ncbi:enoyl-CoA hydratase-related protein [Limibacter armeniacum]|uniref:enoyl-CoA hydratase-related protein n=1 Tax=Limibacter armeniacum TaxID=466084 RepID=UPI002FE5C2D9